MNHAIQPVSQKSIHYPMVIGSDSVDTGHQVLIDPSTSDVFATVALGTPEDVNRAVAIANTAQQDWAKRTPGDRCLVLMKVADALEAHTDELARLESQNSGKPLKLSTNNDIPFSIDNLRFFASAARRPEGTAATEFAAGCTSFVRREPIGVVGAIAPWNYPFAMAMWKIAPALAAGNAIVIKPAPNTPVTTIRFAQIALEAGLPAGLINVVTGGAEVGEAICTHPDIRMVSFTGSTHTGQRVAELAAPRVKRLTLELGGKAPFLVFEDADIEAAAQGAIAGAYLNSGQDCTAATRIYVQEPVFESFLTRFTELSEKVKVGAAFTDDTDIGPLISEAQRLKVHGYVQEARQQEIRIATGGDLPEGKGFFYPPTILVDAPQDSSCVQQEIFGPVVVVNRFSTEDEAIALGNDVAYGLAGSVWTLNVQRAMRVSAALECGTVWVNEHLPIASEMPHGGFKQSGIGKDMSHYALEEHTIVKHVMMDITGDRRKDWHQIVLGNG